MAISLPTEKEPLSCLSALMSIASSSVEVRRPLFLEGALWVDRSQHNHSQVCSIDFRCWHIASVIAAQRHVRSWVQTGSDQHDAEVTRLTHQRHWLCIGTRDLMPVIAPIKLLV